MLVELSRYGRVLHLDWPIEVGLNPTVEDVKEFYKNSSELVRINKRFDNGTVESEYYPKLDLWREEDERED